MDYLSLFRMPSPVKITGRSSSITNSFINAIIPETIVGKEKWQQHWANWGAVQSTMRKAQVLATEINKTIAESYAKP